MRPPLEELEHLPREGVAVDDRQTGKAGHGGPPGGVDLDGVRALTPGLKQRGRGHHVPHAPGQARQVEVRDARGFGTSLGGEREPPIAVELEGPVAHRGKVARRPSDRLEQVRRDPDLPGDGLEQVLRGQDLQVLEPLRIDLDHDRAGGTRGGPVGGGGRSGGLEQVAAVATGTEGEDAQSGEKRDGNTEADGAHREVSGRGRRGATASEVTVRTKVSHAWNKPQRLRHIPSPPARSRSATRPKDPR